MVFVNFGKVFVRSFAPNKNFSEDHFWRKSKTFFQSWKFGKVIWLLKQLLKTFPENAIRDNGFHHFLEILLVVLGTDHKLFRRRLLEEIIFFSQKVGKFGKDFWQCQALLEAFPKNTVSRNLESSQNVKYRVSHIITPPLIFAGNQSNHKNWV